MKREFQDIAEKAEYYFSAIQQSSRHFKQQNTDYKYSLMRILLGYKTEQGYEFKEGKQNFDQEVFVGGILEKGQYLIQVKIQWKDGDEQIFNICSYGSKGVKIQLIEKNEDFISQMMIRLQIKDTQTNKKGVFNNNDMFGKKFAYRNWI